MIVDTDRVDLPAGVSVRSGSLEDTVRRCSWQLNESGVFMLARVDRPLEAVVRELADAFGLPLEVARRDVLGFAWALNALALVNIVPSASRPRRFFDWLRLAARLAPAGSLPAAVSRRRALDTRTVTRAIATSLVATGSRVAVIATAATVVFLELALAVGGRTSGFGLAAALGIGTGIGVGLHEAGHAASLRGVPSALVLRGRRTFVLHASVSPARRALVALSGPVTVMTIGLLFVLGGETLVVPELVILGLPLAAHSCSLTVIGGDGRIACGI